MLGTEVSCCIQMMVKTQMLHRKPPIIDKGLGHYIERVLRGPGSQMAGGMTSPGEVAAGVPGFAPATREAEEGR